MININDIAEFFIRKASLNDDDMSNLKLQKLLYYAQGFYLAENNVPLFKEKIQAWAHGPVVPEIYQKYRVYGAGAITVDNSRDISRIDKETKAFLNKIFNAFAQFSAWGLREMTHKEAPWINAYKRGLNTQITKKSMKEYFKTRI